MQNPLRTLADALSAAGPQSPEVKTKSGVGVFHQADIDTVPVPEDLVDEYEQFRNTPFIAASYYQFASDVTAPGYRVEAESDETADWFNGGDAAPADAPSGGFLSEAGVVAGEKNQDFGEILHQSTIQYLAGNILCEKVKADPTADDPTYTGFMLIRPGSVKYVTQETRPILVSPDADVPNELRTKRGEAAAYLQFHKGSILGSRGQFTDRSVVRLSTNDVIKVARNPVPGTIWGESAISPASELIRGLKQILRDNEQAIQSKAYGIWSVAFGRELLEYPDGDAELIEWSDKDQTEFVEETIGRQLDPGDIIGHDGEISFEKFEGEVASDLLDVIETYVKLIVSALPNPLYVVGFESDINQFVTQAQEPRYEKSVREMRETLIGAFDPALEEIADQQGLSTEGFALRIEPEDEESPIQALDDDDMARLESFSAALKNIYGSGSIPTYLTDEAIVETVLQLPEDAIAESDIDLAPSLDESNEQVMEQFSQMNQSGEQQPATDGGEDDETNGDDGR